MGYPESLRSVSYVNMNNNNNEETLKIAVSSSLKSERSKDICESLQNSIFEAKEEGRITCGVYQAARVLENNPDDVMVCILAADNAQDLELRIHFTLLEAFCWENEIKIIKVDSATKLKNLLYDNNRFANDNDDTVCHRGRAVDCVLIQFPKQKESASDVEVLEFHKASSLMRPKPIIELPE